MAKNLKLIRNMLIISDYERSLFGCSNPRLKDMEDDKSPAPVAAALEVVPIDDGLLDEVSEDDRNVPTPLADINMTLDDSVDWAKSSELEFGTEQHNPETSGLHGPSQMLASTAAPVTTPNQQAASFLHKIGEASVPTGKTYLKNITVIFYNG